MTDKPEDKVLEQQKQLKRLSQKQIERYQEIHRAVQAVADHWRQLPRPR